MADAKRMIRQVAEGKSPRQVLEGNADNPQTLDDLFDGDIDEIDWDDPNRPAVVGDAASDYEIQNTDLRLGITMWAKGAQRIAVRIPANDNVLFIISTYDPDDEGNGGTKAVNRRALKVLGTKGFSHHYDDPPEKYAEWAEDGFFVVSKGQLDEGEILAVWTEGLKIRGKIVRHWGS